jgi:hypothetical protein
MRILFCTLALLFLATILAMAQTNSVDTAYQPQFVLSAGAGWNHYAAPQSAGWMTFGARIADGTYSLTSIDMTSQTSSIRTGLSRVLIRQGYFTLTALGDAGIASGSGTAGAAFSGGGSVLYDISRWSKVEHTYLIGTVRVLKTTLTEVQPVFALGIGKAF